MRIHLLLFLSLLSVCLMAEETPYKYRGFNGVMVKEFRNYMPNIGRFTTVDPVHAGTNWYSYAGGDPVNKWDPTGLYWQVYADPEFGVYQNDDKSLSASWIEDGTAMPLGGPTNAGWHSASIFFDQAGVSYPQGLGAGEAWDGTPPSQDLLPIYMVGPQLNKNPIWNGGSGSESGRWTLPNSFGMRREGGRYLVSGIQNGPQSFDFTGAQEAGMEHYMFLRLEAMAGNKLGLDADLFAREYGVGGVSDMAMLWGLSQWMMETTEGQAAALEYGSLGLAAGAVSYAAFKKFKASKMANRMLPLLNTAREKMTRLMNSRGMQDMGIETSRRFSTGVRRRSQHSAADINEEFINKDWEPPYMPGSSVNVVESVREMRFMRVHGADNKARSWMMRLEDIVGLSPSQIKVKFSLPNMPTHVSEVLVPAGTGFRQGVVNPLFGGAGGAIQYELLGRLPESLFVNTRLLELVP